MNYGSSISRTAAVPGQNRSPLYLLACGRLRFILYRLCRFIKKDADLSPSPEAAVSPSLSERAAGILHHLPKNKASKTSRVTKISQGPKTSQAPHSSQASQISRPSRSCPPLSPRKPCTAMVPPSSVWRCPISITCRTPKISSRKPCSAFSPPPRPLKARSMKRPGSSGWPST